MSYALIDDYRRTAIRKPAPLPTGLDAAVYGLIGRRRSRPAVGEDLLRVAREIDAQEPLWRGKTDDALRARLAEFREDFRRQRKGFETLLPSALGAVREASVRSMGLRPYTVQLAGAMALYRGSVAEMATGEGKTLTAGLTAVLWGWIGRPCHVITVNDYLAERDAKWLEPLYRFCGVTAGCVTSSMDPSARREGYRRDVAYTTSKEIVADFLRDRLWLDTLQDFSRRQIRALSGRLVGMEKGLVMRGLDTAVVDEADSILIDEAVTPLIISRARENDPFVEACRAAHAVADALVPGVDYRVDLQYKDIELLPTLDERLAGDAESLPELFRGPARRRELVRQALNAKEFFHRDRQYVIQEGKVVIVDEFTGRLMPQRTWRAGLHQMIEAKESLSVTPPSETLARLSFQRFFRFFRRLSGMTGTAREASGELWQMYGLPVLSIPENRPCRREIYPRRVFSGREEKETAILNEVVDMSKLGRPVLIGSRSVKASEELAARLAGVGIACRVLNAVRHQEEARIVAEAGQAGRVTVATNMAGRGTDIILGHGVAKAGGLHVIATECHESARIDRQLFGRSARQGDPGSARSFVSMDDELVRRYLPDPLRRGVKALLDRNARGAVWSAEQAVRWSQAKAQRLAFSSRRSVLRTDTWLDDSLSFAHGDVK